MSHAYFQFALNEMIDELEEIRRGDHLASKLSNGQITCICDVTSLRKHAIPLKDGYCNGYRMVARCARTNQCAAEMSASVRKVCFFF